MTEEWDLQESVTGGDLGEGRQGSYGSRCKPSLLDNNFQTWKDCEQNGASICLDKH